MGKFAEQFATIMDDKFDRMAAVLVEDINADASSMDRACAMIAGQAALTTLLAANISGLRDCKIIPADLGHELELTARQLTIDLQKAIKAQMMLDANPGSGLVEKELH
jgi:hypothetical protein